MSSSRTILEVKVTPYSSQNAIVRWEEDRLVIKIKGVPEKGKVNENLILFLATTLKIARSQIELMTGKTSRIKKLAIEGLSLAKIKENLNRIR